MRCLPEARQDAPSWAGRTFSRATSNCPSAECHPGTVGSSTAATFASGIWTGSRLLKAPWTYSSGSSATVDAVTGHSASSSVWTISPS